MRATTRRLRSESSPSSFTALASTSVRACMRKPTRVTPSPTHAAGLPICVLNLGTPHPLAYLHDREGVPLGNPVCLLHVGTHLMCVVSVVDGAVRMPVAMVMAVVMLMLVLVLQDVGALGCGRLHHPHKRLSNIDLWLFMMIREAGCQSAACCACQPGVEDSSCRPNELYSAAAPRQMPLVVDFR